MKRFFELCRELGMPDIDYGVWGSGVGANPGGFVGKLLASTTTLTPTAPIHHVNGTSAITTIVPPYTGFVGRITLIADAAWTLAAGGTSGSDIATALTAVSGQALDLVFDGSTWFPKMMD